MHVFFVHFDTYFEQMTAKLLGCIMLGAVLFIPLKYTLFAAEMLTIVVGTHIKGNSLNFTLNPS